MPNGLLEPKHKMQKQGTNLCEVRSVLRSMTINSNSTANSTLLLFCICNKRSVYIIYNIKFNHPNSKHVIRSMVMLATCYRLGIKKKIMVIYDSDNDPLDQLAVVTYLRTLQNAFLMQVQESY